MSIENSQTPSPAYINIGSISPDTERLFRRWLKLQIAQFYWNFISRLIIIILVVASLAMSAFVIGPMLNGQQDTLMKLKDSLNNYSNTNQTLQP